MKVIEFKPNQGSYQFELEGVSSLVHAHPAVEVIVANEGAFSLEREGVWYRDLKFALIGANVKHRVLAENCRLELKMLEWAQASFVDFLEEHRLVLDAGIFVGNKKEAVIELILTDLTHENRTGKTLDARIQSCLDYFKGGAIDYNRMMPNLIDRVHLSESRLSHLFKQTMGISLKKYAVWNRLKRTIDLVIREKVNLYEASLQCGFYDQAHMSRAFKQMLGMSPSEVYNSRMLQD